MKKYKNHIDAQIGKISNSLFVLQLNPFLVLPSAITRVDSKKHTTRIRINFPLNCINSYPEIFSTHALYAFVPLDHLIVLL